MPDHEMKDPSAVHSTFVIERSYPVPLERVFAAFTDVAKKRRWFGESEGHHVEKFEMTFRVGGTELLLYRFKEGTPFPGVTLANEGTYEDIVPNRRIVTASRMTIGDRRISVSLVTVEFLPTEKGTDLICVNQGAYFEGSDGPQMREGGWRRLFDKLATHGLAEN
jgi:uncharacterized protein YndB with AHSA1/START domain